VPRFLALLVAGVLAMPASAFAKQGAMFSPQLFGLNSGSTTRLELHVLPVYRGERCIASSPCSPPVSGRVLVPAPRVGSVPVVIFRLLGTTKTMRFVGTPLDRDLRSLVRVKLPHSSVSERWVISVHADGRVYPDLTDPVVSTVPDDSAPRVAALPPPVRAEPDGGTLLWPFLGGIALIALAGGPLLMRVRGPGSRLPRRT
jgi:hypothetical protein